MKKLFDETFEHNEVDSGRTIWYLFGEEDQSIHSIFSEPDEYGGRTIKPVDYSQLANCIKELIEEDIRNTSEKKATEIHWILYTSTMNEDAVGDKVRFSILIRLKDGIYSCNINISDYIFVTSFDEVVKIKDMIESSLNR